MNDITVDSKMDQEFITIRVRKYSLACINLEEAIVRYFETVGYSTDGIVLPTLLREIGEIEWDDGI